MAATRSATGVESTAALMATVVKVVEDAVVLMVETTEALKEVAIEGEVALGVEAVSGRDQPQT